MSSPYAIRIAGPSGAEWFMDVHQTRVSYARRWAFKTRDEAEDALEIVEKKFIDQGFVIDVVNTEDGE